MFLISIPAHLKKKQTHTIENTRQASDWALVHFGAISLVAARPLSESQVVTKGGPERLFMMECHLVRLLPFVTTARKLSSAPATSPTTLITLVWRATENKQEKKKASVGERHY